MSLHATLTGMKMDDLPRQARDKHRGNSKNGVWHRRTALEVTRGVMEGTLALIDEQGGFHQYLASIGALTTVATYCSLLTAELEKENTGSVSSPCLYITSHMIYLHGVCLS
jgi:hypothetical protein